MRVVDHCRYNFRMVFWIEILPLDAKRIQNQGRHEEIELHADKINVRELKSKDGTLKSGQGNFKPSGRGSSSGTLVWEGEEKPQRGDIGLRLKQGEPSEELIIEDVTRREGKPGSWSCRVRRRDIPPDVRHNEQEEE